MTPSNNKKIKKKNPKIIQISIEIPCLALYAERKDNMETTDASISRLSIALWQQHDGKIKPIAYGNRYLKDTEQNYSTSHLELLFV